VSDSPPPVSLSDKALVGTLSGPEMTGQVTFGGTAGHRIDITLDPIFKDGRPTNLPPATEPPSYKLVFVLKRPGFPLLGEYEVKAPELLYRLISCSGIGSWIYGCL
jgi:hypothetical protein